MRIAVISDTHGDTRGWQAAITGPFAGVHLILHAGDIFYHGPRNPRPSRAESRGGRGCEDPLQGGD